MLSVAAPLVHMPRFIVPTKPVRSWLRWPERKRCVATPAGTGCSRFAAYWARRTLAAAPSARVPAAAAWWFRRSLDYFPDAATDQLRDVSRPDYGLNREKSSSSQRSQAGRPRETSSRWRCTRRPPRFKSCARSSTLATTWSSPRWVAPHLLFGTRTFLPRY